MRFERWIYMVPLRLRSLLRRGRVEAELDEELRYHLERQAEENVARGMPPDEARYAALRAMGGVELRKEECRDARRVRFLEDFVRDLRYGLRVMLKHRGFTAVAVLALALGIGANTTIFSMVNGFVLRPLPVRNPEELVVPFWGGKTDDEVWGPFSYANYVDLRERNKSLSGLLAVTLTSAGVSSGGGSNAGDDGRAEVALGEVVSGNYFDVLGVEPVLGRGFLPEEDRTQNAHPVVVISHALWKRRLDSDPSVLGRTIYLNGSPFTIVGVAPEAFKGVTFGARPSFWVPLMMLSKFGLGEGWEANRGWRTFDLMGRRKPGVTAAQAEADLNLALEDLARLYPTNENSKIQVVSELDGRFSSMSGFFKLTSAIALCAASLVLLVACANVANLMLARAVARTREIGIRLAIGASRFRVVRQLLTESLLLASLGGALGWLLARWGTGLVNASLPPMPLPVELDVSPDLTVFKWMVAVSLLTGVISGLAPALLASRPDLVAVIKGDGAAQAHGRGRRWSLRGVLVVAQVAISVVVLICAGLFLRSLNKALQVDPGFSTENLVTMRLDTGLLGYDYATSERYYTELLRRVESLPGVRAASLADHLPLENEGSLRDNVMKEGEPDPLPNEGLVVPCDVVRPKYFETVRTPLVAGRDFAEQDDGDAPRVVIVNQEFARRFYGGEQDALGKRFRFWHTSQPLMEIVGVVRDGRYENLYEDPQPFMFLPHSQHFESDMSLLISATSAADLKAVTERARQEIARVDARMPVFAVQVAEQNLSFAYWAPRLAAGMSTALGLLALALATTGLYGVMTYAVTQRTQEIGIRMALGARVADVLRLILGQGIGLVLIGIAVGLAGAFAATRVLSGMLLGVGATDAATFLGVALLLVVVGSLACLIPARRAARVDPLRALRYE